MQANRYSSVNIVLHWLTFMLIVLVYCTMEFRGIFERGSAERELVKSVHYMAGLTVLLLTVLRLYWRRRQAYPPIEPAPTPWQHRCAVLVHCALYLLLLGMPLLGWLLLSADGKQIPFWGLELPALVAVNPQLAEWAEQLHELIAQLGYALIGLHALAALWHHYIKKDNTLARMKW